MDNELRKPLIAHGIYVSSDSDSDFEGKKELDEEYERNKPPPIDYESIKYNIVFIQPKPVEKIVRNNNGTYANILKKQDQQQKEKEAIPLVSGNVTKKKRTRKKKTIKKQLLEKQDRIKTNSINKLPYDESISGTSSSNSCISSTISVKQTENLVSVNVKKGKTKNAAINYVKGQKISFVTQGKLVNTIVTKKKKIKLAANVTGHQTIKGKITVKKNINTVTNTHKNSVKDPQVLVGKKKKSKASAFQNIAPQEPIKRQKALINNLQLTSNEKKLVEEVITQFDSQEKLKQQQQQLLTYNLNNFPKLPEKKNAENMPETSEKKNSEAIESHTNTSHLISQQKVVADFFQSAKNLPPNVLQCIPVKQTENLNSVNVKKKKTKITGNSNVEGQQVSVLTKEKLDNTNVKKKLKLTANVNGPQTIEGKITGNKFGDTITNTLKNSVKDQRVIVGKKKKAKASASQNIAPQENLKGKTAQINNLQLTSNEKKLEEKVITKFDSQKKLKQQPQLSTYNLSNFPKLPENKNPESTPGTSENKTSAAVKSYTNTNDWMCHQKVVADFIQSAKELPPHILNGTLTDFIRNIKVLQTPMKELTPQPKDDQESLLVLHKNSKADSIEPSIGKNQLSLANEDLQKLFYYGYTGKNFSHFLDFRETYLNKSLDKWNFTNDSVVAETKKSTDLRNSVSSIERDKISLANEDVKREQYLNMPLDKWDVSTKVIDEHKKTHKLKVTTQEQGNEFNPKVDSDTSIEDVPETSFPSKDERETISSNIEKAKLHLIASELQEEMGQFRKHSENGNGQNSSISVFLANNSMFDILNSQHFQVPANVSLNTPNNTTETLPNEEFTIGNSRLSSRERQLDVISSSSSFSSSLSSSEDDGVDYEQLERDLLTVEPLKKTFRIYNTAQIYNENTDNALKQIKFGCDEKNIDTFSDNGLDCDDQETEPIPDKSDFVEINSSRDKPKCDLLFKIIHLIVIFLVVYYIISTLNKIWMSIPFRLLFVVFIFLIFIKKTKVLYFRN